MKPRPERRRREPYYKVQYHDHLTLAWKDHRKNAFNTLDEARRYLLANLDATPLRIVEFDAHGPKVIHEQR